MVSKIPLSLYSKLSTMYTVTTKEKIAFKQVYDLLKQNYEVCKNLSLSKFLIFIKENKMEYGICYFAEKAIDVWCYSDIVFSDAMYHYKGKLKPYTTYWCKKIDHMKTKAGKLSTIKKRLDILEEILSK